MRQPDDPGVDRYPADPLGPPEPFDPDPMKRLRESPWIRGYLIAIVLVIMATVVFWE